jgi:manganese efflux pump family protein
VPLLLAAILPLSVDTFAASASLGIIGITRRRRLLFSAVFACFEGGMPLIGLLFGAALGERIGGVADYIAIAALVGLGAFMLLGDEENEAQRLRSLAQATGPAVVTAGVLVSLDELAIGFALGLLNVPLAPALAAIAVQAIVVSQVGFAVGAKVGERVAEGAEKLAGVAFLALGGALLLGRLLALPV